MPKAEWDFARHRNLALAVATAVVFGLRHSAFGIDSDRIYNVLVAEDSRSGDPVTIQVLVDATRDADSRLRRMAVRALGRLERPALADRIAPVLQDSDAAVRREAVNALGQSLFDATSTDVGPAAALLSERLSREPDVAVRGVILQTLGRLEYSSESDIRAAERTLAGYASPLDSDWWHDPSGSFGQVSRRSIDELDGAVRGLSRLFARRPTATPRLAPETVNALNETARRSFPTVGAAMEAERYARVRRLAVQTLGASSALDEDLAASAFTDRDWQVRRLVVLHGMALPGGRARTIAALKDHAPQVRFEALRSLGQAPQITCATVAALTQDDDRHVARRAVVTLGRPCEDGTKQTLDLLGRLASTGSRGSAGRWWMASSALTSLAAGCARGDETTRKDSACMQAPEIARDHSRDPVWQVRMYSAVPVSGFGDLATLRRLAEDPNPNVRVAAIERLGATTPRADADLIVHALKADDYHLVLTAAHALKDSSTPSVTVALRAAFDRLAAKHSDTARDPLTALRDSLRAHGVEVAVPPSSPKEPPFTRTELDDLLARDHRAVVTMTSGRSFELALIADEAPATVARFVRLARRGVYGGLTFHRVEPTFVIQGGSPAANEYAGHDPYMRDEVGLASHDRGTVGISTRGRDTGDAQIFVNLVDNPRLDHRYTVFARVVRGIDVVDGIVEGDGIARIVIHLQN
jgi:cyclophilin family peptidyl-prolyl cis-trans isomerase